MAAKQILVTGDFVLDNHIYEGKRSHYGDNKDTGVKLITQLGGAALVHQILENLFKDDDEKNKKNEKDKQEKENTEKKEPVWESVLGIKDPTQKGEICKISPAEQAFAFWRPFPKKADPEKQFWRVSEAMGFGSDAPMEKCEDISLTEIPPDQNPVIVVYSEGGMGFRNCRKNWREDKLDKASWIILKTTSPIATGDLWKHLAENYSEKLIVIVSGHELRKSPSRMNAGLSWEETIEGVLRELGSRGILKALTINRAEDKEPKEYPTCRHLIIAFDSEGALWLDMSKGFDDARACLVYESGVIEGEHDNLTDGTAFGFLSCLTAAVAHCLTRNQTAFDLAPAIESGLNAMHDLREKGHGPLYDRNLAVSHTGYPAERLAGIIKETTFRCSRAIFNVNDPLKSLQDGSAIRWSLLRQAQHAPGPAYDLARLVLLRGPIALDNLPHLKIGNLLTADRSEIESLRTLILVIRRYKDKKNPGKKPLSIGVFGPPGAGKSFAVKELAGNLVDDVAWMEFNLSQFAKPEDLNGAFHQIRDQVLKGRLPVAFFDEFDSGNYKWLQYLLAPMQDGKFQQGQLTHTLGKCIFIFAGGTSPTYETFGPPNVLSDDGQECPQYQEFRLLKGPDFKSRLDAYLDVLGPNQRQIPAKPSCNADGPIEKICGRDFILDPSDIVFPVRRAMMIRAQLKCKRDDKLEMDERLVHALLYAKKYTHGNRSLEKILQPFAAARPGGLHASLLMPINQLAMYTDAEAFISLYADAPKPFSPEAPLTKEQIEKIAPAIHETYRDLGRKEGWLKPEKDKDFNDPDLKEFFRESSRAAASRMLHLLAFISMQLVYGEASEDEEQIAKQHLEYYMLTLAEAEHEGWMKWHFKQGWHYHPDRNDEEQKHNYLLPFFKLSDKIKNIDRDSIRHYPDFARKAEMKIVFNESSLGTDHLAATCI